MSVNPDIHHVDVGSFKIGSCLPLALIAGPCQIEGRDHALFHAEALLNAAQIAGMNFIYKSSFDKANRTSANSARGVGIEEGLRILEDVKHQFGCPVLTDVHTSEQCEVLLDALGKRNLITHTYDEENAIEAKRLILNDYSPILATLSANLTIKSENE